METGRGLNNDEIEKQLQEEEAKMGVNSEKKKRQKMQKIKKKIQKLWKKPKKLLYSQN